MALDIQSRRRKAKDKETLAKRLAKERKEKREKEREEKEMSRITDNPLTALAVERPNAPEIEEGVSLRSLTGNPAVTMKPNSPPKDGGPIDWDAVSESNPGQPKKPVVFIPPGSQKAEADKLLPGGEQGPVAPPEDNTIDQFADAAEEAGELAAAIASGNEGKQETTGGLPTGTKIDDPEGDPGNPTLYKDSKGLDTKKISDNWLKRTTRDLFDDIDSNLQAQLDDYAAEEAGELADVDEAELAAAIASGNEGKQYTSGIETKGSYSGIQGANTEHEAVDDGMSRADYLLADIDSNLQAQLDDYAAENPIDIEGDQEADPEALAENELFPDRKVKNPNSLPGPEEEGGMMQVAEEEDEPVAEVNPVQAARAKRRSAEFWAQRMRAPVENVMTVMDIAEQELLAENPDATPEEIKQAQIVALETDEDLAKHKEVHAGQIQAAVHRQADQTNRARIMGVPRGMVMMLDQINDAQTPDDIVKGLVTASGVYPQFRPMLQNVITGQVSANALKSQLAAAMMQASTQRYVADAGRPLPPEPDRTPQAIANDLKNPTFDSQGVQKASFALMEGGLEGEAKTNQVALSFAPQMRAVAQQILNDESPIQADLNTAREVIQLAIGDEMPSAAQVNRLFGGGMTGSQIEKVMHLLYGEAGLRNLHTLGPLRGVAKDWGMGDPATWFGFDDLDNVG